MADESNIRLGRLYGDYRAMRRIKPAIYGMQCIHCGTRRKITKGQMHSVKMAPKCAEKGCVKPEDKQDMAFAAKDATPAVKGKLDATYSTFLDNMGDALRVLDAVSNSSETGFDRASVKMLLDLIPHAERRYRKWSSQPNAYALNSLLTQVREILADLQASEGRDELLISVIKETMRETAHDMMQVLVDNTNFIWGRLKDDLPENRRERLHDAVKDIGIESARKSQDVFRRTLDDLAAQIMNPRGGGSAPKQKRLAHVNKALSR